MGKIYRTAQGRQLDIERLRLQNELVPAIGNMRVNARGDQLGPGGKIVKNREQMLDEHYKNNVSRRAATEDNIPTKGGKAKKAESFEPGKIEPDTAVARRVETETVDDFEDPVPTPAAPKREIKGGLAKAMAKTQNTDEKKKPKRL